VIELSQGVIVRDEVGGGYGETASIPVQDLTAAGVQVLRTTEDVVRAALAPGEAAAGPTDETVLDIEGDLEIAEGGEADASGGPEQVEVPEHASVVEEPRPFGDEDEAPDDTVRSPGMGDDAEPGIPSFL